MLVVLNMLGFWIYLPRNIRKFHFLKHKEFFGGFQFWKCKKSFLLRKYMIFFRDFRFLKYKNFSQDGLKGSISWNIRSFFRVSVSWIIRNFFGVSVSWIFLILELRSSISWNIKIFFSGWIFYFFNLGQKIALSNSIICYLLLKIHRLLKSDALHLFFPQFFEPERIQKLKFRKIYPRF